MLETLFFYRSFSPMFDILRSMCEKLSSCHADSVLRLNDIIKELSKYNEEYKSKQKQVKRSLQFKIFFIEMTLIIKFIFFNKTSD